MSNQSSSFSSPLEDSDFDLEFNAAFNPDTDDFLLDLGDPSAQNSAMNPSFQAHTSFPSISTPPQKHNQILQNQTNLQNNNQLQPRDPPQLPTESQFVQIQPTFSNGHFQQWGNTQYNQPQQNIQGHQHGQSQRWGLPQQYMNNQPLQSGRYQQCGIPQLQHYGAPRHQPQQYSQVKQQYTQQQAPFSSPQNQQTTAQSVDNFINETSQFQQATAGPQRSKKGGKGPRTGPYTKAKQRPLPKTLAEADVIDKMVWQKRHEGLSWSHINKEYTKMTGEKLGHSTLGVRFSKMEKDFARNGGAAADSTLLRFATETSSELLGKFWLLVADKMAAAHSELRRTPQELASRWRELSGSAASPLSLGGPSPEGDEKEEEEIEEEEE